MREYLKIKVKTLTAEARIIRNAEKKAKMRRQTDLLQGLHIHRTFVVRRAARSSHLAYGFLRGVPYRAMEQKGSRSPSWSDIQKLAERYGEGDRRDIAQKFAEWKAEAD